MDSVGVDLENTKLFKNLVSSEFGVFLRIETLLFFIGNISQVGL